jgi:hypothetical protein
MIFWAKPASNLYIEIQKPEGPQDPQQLSNSNETGRIAGVSCA